MKQDRRDQVGHLWVLCWICTVEHLWRNETKKEFKSVSKLWLKEIVFRDLFQRILTFNVTLYLLVNTGWGSKTKGAICNSQYYTLSFYKSCKVYQTYVKVAEYITSLRGMLSEQQVLSQFRRCMEKSLFPIDNRDDFRVFINTRWPQSTYKKQEHSLESQLSFCLWTIVNSLFQKTTLPPAMTPPPSLGSFMSLCSGWYPALT